MRSLTTCGRLGGSGPFTDGNLQGAIRLLMHAFQESGIAGVVADGVEQRVHAEECHGEAVAVERVLERVEGMVEFVDAKIIDADFVSGAGVGCGGEESAGPARANRPAIRAADTR